MIPTRTLGKTGLHVTRVGLGLAALGRPGYINVGHADDIGADRGVEAMERHAHAVLDAAFDAGVRYFDAARSYGRAEAFLSTWIGSREIAPGAIVVGSKWGYRYTAGWEVDVPEHEIKEHSLDMLRNQWRESAALLGAHLDLYQIHSATLESGVLEDRAVLDALQSLSDEGTAVGLTTSGPAQAATVRRALEIDAPNPFSCVQATWNPLETSAGSALAEAHEAGWGVIVKEAVANGRLTARGDAPSAFRDLAKHHDVGLDSLALSVGLAQPWADVVLSGATTSDQLAGNLAGVEVTLGEEDLETIAAVAETPEAYWATRSAMPWN